MLAAAALASVQLVPEAVNKRDISPEKMDVFIDSNCFMFGARTQWLASGGEGVAHHSAEFEQTMQQAASQLGRVVRLLLVPRDIVVEIEAGTGSDPQAQADDPAYLRLRSIPTAVLLGPSPWVAHHCSDDTAGVDVEIDDFHGVLPQRKRTRASLLSDVASARTSRA